MLGGSTETESSSKTDKHGIDISEQIGENDKYKYFDTYKPNETDVVIPNVRVGWHKSKNKSKSRIQNVRCLINYALKNSDYALVSCYNSEKGYRDYEHIFRPTKEEENFYSKLKKDKEKESHNRASSSLDYTNQFSIGTNKNGKGATKSNITPVMPAWMQGYSSLGEFIKGKRMSILKNLKRTSRRRRGRKKRIPCTYIKINEDKTIECVDKDKLNEIIIFKDIEGKNLSTVENDAIRTAIHKGQNLNTADNVDRSSATDSSTVESIDNFETTEDSIFKTPMFRGSTLAALLVGVVSVFFIYYKVYNNYKMCAYISYFHS
ncbi:CYIR protein [Plasmodium cynomolgi strain B]|uniref:CYIR protein n=1 Tax=Plasmodium cynomolgi (strain B) TaxID=1120755 RepID=K6V2Q1_PLACD|nr:CYIR protein [Plasmodium cynomolgi strain B]GAB69540.1 CYIR protein [Plasmodium cynomolgi strain B]